MEAVGVPDELCVSGGGEGGRKKRLGGGTWSLAQASPLHNVLIHPHYAPSYCTGIHLSKQRLLRTPTFLAITDTVFMGDHVLFAFSND